MLSLDDTTSDDTVELKDRELIDLPAMPDRIFASVRHFGVSLDNIEAQHFIRKGFRVFGDRKGPYLVVRIPAGRPWSLAIDEKGVDITFRPVRWTLRQETGIICWLAQNV